MFQQSSDTPDVWQHDMYEDDFRPKRVRPATGGGATGGSGKLHISNLDFGVSESDIQVRMLESLISKQMSRDETNKTNKMSVRPAKTQFSLGIHPV